MKALVLAAGLGTRLKPITNLMPKPLVPVLNESLLAVALRQLKKAGFTSFALNAHYMPESIEAFAREAQSQGFDVRVSVELPSILGTGGAFMPLKSWFGSESFMVYNGDLLSDIAFKALKDQHLAGKNLVTMAVKLGHNGKDLAVWATEESPGVVKVHDIARTPPPVEGVRSYTYACAYMADPKLLDYLPPSGESFVIDGMVKGLKEGRRITGLVHSGYWADLGTPQTLYQANIDLLDLPPERRSAVLALDEHLIAPVHKSADVAKTAQLGPHTVIGANAKIGERAHIQNAVILPGSLIKDDEKIASMICGPNGIRISI